MKKILFLIAITITTMINAQSASEIINQHFKNTGGYTAWENLNSVEIEGAVYLGVSTPVRIKIEHQKPYYKRVSFVIDGMEKLSEGYDGKNGYTYNDITKKNEKLKNYTPEPFQTDILDYQKKGFKVAYLNKEKVQGKLTFKVMLYKGVEKKYYWFSTENYYLLQMRDSNETVNYADFKNFKGLIFATKMEYQPLKGKDYTVIFNQIQPNKKINPKRFKFE